MDKTLGYVLCCQSPGLFLAAAALIIAYFAGRRRHRFKAVLRLLLGIVCALGGLALYYMGMYHDYFTIRDFYQIRLSGWIGFGIVALLVLLALVRAFFAAADARREEKAANRAENQRLAAEAAAEKQRQAEEAAAEKQRLAEEAAARAAQEAAVSAAAVPQAPAETPAAEEPSVPEAAKKE